MKVVKILKAFIVIILFFGIPGVCQIADTLNNITLQEVTVTAYKEKPLKESTINVTSLNIDSLKKSGNYNLTDLMAKLPGVDMLSTGVAIAKPVIRGLYGNRILILLSGLRFDNQQWQDEHGLGLSDMGIAKVELIKGPMSVLYGSEAMGGIINLIEEEKPSLNSKQGSISLRVNSNTRGGLLQGGYKVSKEKKWWRVRVGVENNADYSDGNNDRVLNSRFDGYYMKATFGFHRGNWTSTNNMMSSFNRYGFIFNDIYTFISPDSRWNRSLGTNPDQLVLLNIFSSENKILLKDDSKLSLNAGIQSNKRMENEGGGAISLNMHLFTSQYLLKWEKQISPVNRLIISNLGSYEDNTNFGARKIVPDAGMQESNISGFLETIIRNDLILENGLGVGEKWTKTYFTATVNGPEKEVYPFSIFSPYYNFYSGFTYLPDRYFNFKFNIASGVRIPNLAELSSNGLHEGIFTYEIGDPKLKNEKNISLNAYLNFRHDAFSLSLSPFYRLFNNYVYLTPTEEEWYGFPVYRYKQQNARQYGTEFMITYRPTRKLSAGLSYSGMNSKTQDGNYTPYIPAHKISPNVTYSLIIDSKTIKFYGEADYNLSQNRTAPHERATPEYWLLNIGASTLFKHKNKEYRVSLSANNLLNNAYYDHLSRFKYYGLLNMGRNIILGFKINLNGPAGKD